VKPGLLLVCVAATAFALFGRTDDALADVYVRDDIIVDPVPASFSVCHGRSCTVVSPVSLDDGQWSSIARLFAVPAANPQQERERIADAIALFETIVGKLTGTAGDKARNGYDRDWESQMDCIDESTNTTSYLKILAHGGLLKWHAVEDRVTRSTFFLFFPHTTAVVRDLQSGKLWAVDSWFFANGERPVIVPLDEWKRGWEPPER
jgi:hypothetical protein